MIGSKQEEDTGIAQGVEVIQSTIDETPAYDIEALKREVQCKLSRTK
jgi:hypothetical protein